uniref:Uncharacterized protein n=1 Tax=Triticum urartu TaxID=4572 RepID=A0A8R7V4T5_TRIUA
MSLSSLCRLWQGMWVQHSCSSSFLLFDGELLVAAGDDSILHFVGLLLISPTATGFSSLLCDSFWSMLNGRGPLRFLGEGFSGLASPFDD